MLIKKQIRAINAHTDFRKELLSPGDCVPIAWWIGVIEGITHVGIPHPNDLQLLP